MSGIYIHIPFCKQACHYCDFHFSTQLKKKEALVAALQEELLLRKSELEGTTIETLYFGGGTPSLLSDEELAELIHTAKKHYTFHKFPEITIEVNPDDVNLEQVRAWKSSGLNRVSLGIQSFFDEDLNFMNRAHSAKEARDSIALVRAYFENVSIDLIYGFPQLTREKWISNLETMLAFDIPHLSAYALTVEPRTALDAFIKKGKVPALDDQLTEAHFELLTARMETGGFTHYEISNFGKPGYFSKNNTAYWTGKPYLGIGPSAHSFDGLSRAWNIANNSKYIAALNKGELPLSKENLSLRDRYNEYIMTGLRTIWGVSESQIASRYGDSYLKHFRARVTPFLDNGKLILQGDTITVAKTGKLWTDGIAADLFILDGKEETRK